MVDDQVRALQWLVRELGRHPEGRSDVQELHASGTAPFTLEAFPALLRQAAALGLVAYRGPDADGCTEVWLTVQGEQALGSLQAMDEVSEG